MQRKFTIDTTTQAVKKPVENTYSTLPSGMGTY